MCFFDVFFVCGKRMNKMIQERLDNNNKNNFNKGDDKIHGLYSLYMVYILSFAYCIIC